MSLWSMVAELKEAVDDGEINPSCARKDPTNCKCDACFIVNMFEHLNEDDDSEPGYDSDDDNMECISDEQAKRINYLYDTKCNDENVSYEDYDEY